MVDIMYTCDICNKILKNKSGLVHHRKFHDELYMKNFKATRSGKKGSMYGKENKWGHHNEDAKQRISISRIGDKNPAKKPEVRRKISLALKGNKSWNKGMKWSRSEFHDSKMEMLTKELENNGYRVFTTHKYVPDAILVDFKNKKVKAFELNPSSIIRVQERSKQKGYDDLCYRVIKK